MCVSVCVYARMCMRHTCVCMCVPAFVHASHVCSIREFYKISC